MFLFYSEEQIMLKFIENWGGISFSINVQKTVVKCPLFSVVTISLDWKQVRCYGLARLCHVLPFYSMVLREGLKNIQKRSLYFRDYHGIFWTIWDYMGLSGGTIWDYLGPFRTRVQVEAGESKLLLFETFSWIFFFTRAIHRGARAPKNKDDLKEYQIFRYEQ